MAKPTARCVLDRTRPCMSCVADSPAECPYPYLMADTDPAALLVDTEPAVVMADTEHAA